jgi:hypothetical protein
MANLSNPTFQIDILTGMPNDYRVTGSVKVELSPFETFLVNAGLPLKLQSTLWGDDGGFNGADDNLFSFSTQNITAPGTYTFSAIVRRGVLNEDDSLFDKRDEVYNRFSLVSGSNLFPINVSPINSPTITGTFG